MDYAVIFQIAGIGIIIAFLQVVLKQMGRDDFAQWVTLAGFALILFKVAFIVNDLFDKVKTVFLFQS